MKGYKGFDSNFKCQNFQFEVGKTYEYSGDVSLCNSGFHFVLNPLDAFGYYPPAGSRFAEIKAEEVSDKTDSDSKRVAKKITIIRELSFSEMSAARIAQIDWSKAEKGTASGDSGAATASGDRGAATASGVYGAATASGVCGAATASGDRGAATASGYSGAATASGVCGAATASGVCCAATASGEESCAIALGILGKAKGIKGTWLTISEWKNTDCWHRISVKTVKVDGKKIKADIFYMLKKGKFVIAG